MLPWGKPEWMWKRIEVSPLIFVRIAIYLGMISAGSNIWKLEFF